MSFADRLEHPPVRDRGIRFLVDGTWERVRWEELYADALRAAGSLAARGAGPGATVGLLGGSSRAMVTALLGCLVGGASPVVLPAPGRRAAPAEASASAERLLRRIGVSLVVREPGFELPGAVESVLASSLAAGPEGSRVPRAPGDVALLQLTSGTTEHARAVEVTDGALSAYLTAICEAIGRDPESDLQLSWLPLHYDLGLISGLLFAAGTGTEFALAPAEAFMRAPAAWMRWMTELRATETLAPSFAYGIAAAMPSDGVELSQCTFFANGGEMVSAAATERFMHAMAARGLDPGVMGCGYGLAEATSAVTVGRRGVGMHVDEVDGEVLERDREAVPVAGDAGSRSRSLVSNGLPLPGVVVRVRDPHTGELCEERRVGEIEISGPTLGRGYAGEPEASAGIWRDGWLATGDLGYLAGGELFPCGRLKDLIIAAGRNIAPEQIELAAASIEGVRRGNVIAFSIDGAAREEIVVVAECRGAPDGIRDAIAREVRAEVGLSPYDVLLIAPGTLPKTASGKLRRSTCRTRYLRGELLSF